MLKHISVTATVLAATVCHLASADKILCPANYDVCGWTLTGTYGYAQNDLIVAAADNGVSVSAAYDSIYNCDENGDIWWSTQCGSGACNAGVNGRTDATCKGASPSDQDGDQGDDGSDDGDGGDGGDGGEGDDVGDDSSNGVGGGPSAGGPAGAFRGPSPSLTEDVPLTTLRTTVIGIPTTVIHRPTP
ncbi:hypothetical protein SPI_05493 [Niveomyces insectorum RCEF 264]|uniref:Uncharacterized protein n=1 Tax=Niveomyces insectorum RCEF 264 TaxID=1081102 RepID=A0A167T9V5_9HYPO|nr:hypothetical protein SPI_05493 [Niveomyces insectorum RCEF 264]